MCSGHTPDRWSPRAELTVCFEEVFKWLRSIAHWSLQKEALSSVLFSSKLIKERVMQIFLKLTERVFRKAVSKEECEEKRKVWGFEHWDINILVPRTKKGNRFHFQQGVQALLAETLNKSLEWFLSCGHCAGRTEAPPPSSLFYCLLSACVSNNCPRTDSYRAVRSDPLKTTYSIDAILCSDGVTIRP